MQKRCFFADILISDNSGSDPFQGLTSQPSRSVKIAANARDAPYQSLIKVWLQEKLHSH